MTIKADKITINKKDKLYFSIKSYSTVLSLKRLYEIEENRNDKKFSFVINTMRY